MVFIITDEFIEAIKSDKGGYTRAQLDALGVAWPPAKGWKASVIGKPIARETAAWLYNRAQHRKSGSRGFGL